MRKTATHQLLIQIPGRKRPHLLLVKCLEKVCLLTRHHHSSYIPNDFTAPEKNPKKSTSKDSAASKNSKATQSAVPPPPNRRPDETEKSCWSISLLYSSASRGTSTQPSSNLYSREFTVEKICRQYVCLFSLNNFARFITNHIHYRYYHKSVPATLSQPIITPLLNHLKTQRRKQLKLLKLQDAMLRNKP